MFLALQGKIFFIIFYIFGQTSEDPRSNAINFGRNALNGIKMNILV